MNNEVVRVLVTSPLGVGGVTNMMIHIQEHLDRSKINFDYLVFHDRHEPMEDKVLSLGSKKYVASADNVKFRPFRRIWRINEIRKVCKRNHIKGLVDDDKGFTNLIVQSSKGERILDRIADRYELYATNLEKAIELDGTMICHSAEPHPRRDEYYLNVDKETLRAHIQKFVPIRIRDYLIEKSNPV